MTPIGFIANVDGKVATLEPDVAVAADGLGTTTPIVP